jgi:signal transduction histidine kinase
VSLQNNGALDIEIADDGNGFAECATSGMGLVSMRERVEEVSGRLSISSHVGIGTTVRAILPMDPT